MRGLSRLGDHSTPSQDSVAALSQERRKWEGSRVGGCPGRSCGGRCDPSHAHKAETAGELTEPMSPAGGQPALALDQEALWTVLLEIRKPLRFL